MVSCKYGECHKPAMYFIGWSKPPEYDRDKVFGLVCGQHDRELGVTNLMVAFGLSHWAAINLNLRLNKEAKLEDGGQYDNRQTGTI